MVTAMTIDKQSSVMIAVSVLGHFRSYYSVCNYLILLSKKYYPGT